MSLFSFASTIVRMALPKKSEQACMLRPSTVSRLNCSRSGKEGFALPLAAGTRQVEQTFHFGLVVADVAIAADIDQVVRVQAVVLRLVGCRVDARVRLRRVNSTPGGRPSSAWAGTAVPAQEM